jgi:hypothetical protein
MATPDPANIQPGNPLDDPDSPDTKIVHDMLDNACEYFPNPCFVIKIRMVCAAGDDIRQGRIHPTNDEIKQFLARHLPLCGCPEGPECRVGNQL